jgi:hypothetical protein
MREKKSKETKIEESSDEKAMRLNNSLYLLALACPCRCTYAYKTIPTLGKEKAGDLRSEMISLFFSLPRLYYCCHLRPFIRLFKPVFLFPDTTVIHSPRLPLRILDSLFPSCRVACPVSQSGILIP